MSGYVVCYWFVWVVVVDNLVLEFVLGVGGGLSGLDLALDGASMGLLWLFVTDWIVWGLV